MIMLSNLHYFRYPSFIWAQRILRLISSQIGGDFFQIYDMPCGDGIISYWLGKKLDKTFYLIDIDHNIIEKCKEYYKKQNVYQGNLYDVKIEESKTLWLIINSLYCLDSKELFSNKHPKYIIGIFPYIDHNNYKAFFKNNSQAKNPNEMSKEETILFFNSHNYRNIYVEDITYIPLNKISRFMKRFNKILIAFDYLEMKRGKKAIYWLGLFIKEEHLLFSEVVNTSGIFK
jgi:hypothetical protein